MVKKVAEDFTNLTVETDTTENGETTRDMELVYFILPMEISMMVNGAKG